MKVTINTKNYNSSKNLNRFRNCLENDNNLKNMVAEINEVDEEVSLTFRDSIDGTVIKQLTFEDSVINDKIEISSKEFIENVNLFISLVVIEQINEVLEA